VDHAAVGNAEVDELRVVLLRVALELVAGEGGDTVHWWSPGAPDSDASVAAAAGMTAGRRLLQMQRPLPTGLPVDVETHAFRPGVDEEVWLAVNNRAFASHPEQGGWTLDTLHGRLAEPWFDAAGFRLHEREGRLAAFCWTKLHTADDTPATSPHTGAVGEIYVIGVDPDFQGLGLGRQLTLAGLQSISERGIDTGMLFVDAANVAAVTLYERLGFAISRTDVAYTVDVAPSARLDDHADRDGRPTN